MTEFFNGWRRKAGCVLLDRMHAIVQVVCGILYGVGILSLAPIITGRNGFVDIGGSYYISALGIGGFLVALIDCEHFWKAPLSIAVGEACFVWTLQPMSFTWPLGLLVMFLLFCFQAIPSFCGATGAFLLTKGLRENWGLSAYLILWPNKRKAAQPPQDSTVPESDSSP